MNPIYYLRDMSYNSYSYSEFYVIEEQRWFISRNSRTHNHILHIPDKSYKSQALLLISLGLTKDEIEDQLGTNNANRMVNSN